MKSSRTGTLLFLFLSAITIPILVIAVQKFNIFTPKASGVVPQYLTIANITDTSATLTWTTPTSGTVTNLQWGETAQLGTIESDFRDKRDKTTLSRNTHFVQLAGLKPNTTYYFRITSGTVDYPSVDQQPATFKTISAPTTDASNQLTIYGDTSAKVKDAILFVYVQTATGFTSAAPLATTLNTDGTWFINLATARTNDGEYLSITDETPLAVIMHTNADGYVGVHTSKNSPLSLTQLTAITQAKIDQTLLATPISTTTTPSATPTVTKRQDVPLLPKGNSTPIPTTTGTANTTDMTRAQLLATFSTPSVSNVSDSTLSVMFVTSTSKDARLLYGTSATSLPSSKYDDANTGTSPRYLHHYTLTGLSANTSYYFRNSLEDTVRSIKLPVKISAPAGQTIIVGSLENGSGQCIVRTQIKRGNTISAVITTIPATDLSWTANIAPVRNSALDSYMVPGPTDTVLSNAFCIASNGDVYYQGGSTTVQNAMSSGLTLELIKLQ